MLVQPLVLAALGQLCLEVRYGVLLCFHLKTRVVQSSLHLFCEETDECIEHQRKKKEGFEKINSLYQRNNTAQDTI